MLHSFLERLDILRHRCGFAFHITSGYRDSTHPSEAGKAKGGRHTQGIAADIAVTNSVERYRLINTAMRMGFNGIGIAGNFIHVDDRNTAPVVWTY